MKKIFHIYANLVNLGDWGSALGIRKLLREVIDEPIEYREHFTSYKSSHRRNLVAEINNEYDAVIIGGGGLFLKKNNGYFDSNWPLGILINFSKRELAQIKPPIFFFSVGINQNLDEKKRLSPH